MADLQDAFERGRQKAEEDIRSQLREREETVWAFRAVARHLCEVVHLLGHVTAICNHYEMWITFSGGDYKSGSISLRYYPKTGLTAYGIYALSEEKNLGHDLRKAVEVIVYWVASDKIEGNHRPDPDFTAHYEKLI